MRGPPTPTELIELRDPLEALCKEAAAAILAVQERLVKGRDVGSRMKEDRSPVTDADQAAHDILAKGLPGVADHPVVSEEDAESVEVEGRPYWLVDPLDGTKEFLAGRDEFTVNVALVVDGRARLGFVLVPATGEAFFGVVEAGAWRNLDGSWGSIHVTQLEPERPCRVVVSRSHRGEAVSTFLAGLRSAEHVIEERQSGSSLKLCRVATGEAHVYPRFGPTMHWDTAAAHAVVEGAQGTVTDIKGKRLAYLEGDRKNPWFIAGGTTYRPWHSFVPDQED